MNIETEKSESASRQLNLELLLQSVKQTINCVFPEWWEVMRRGCAGLQGRCAVSTVVGTGETGMCKKGVQWTENTLPGKKLWQM